MIKRCSMLLILSLLLGGCFYYEAPIQASGDVYIYMSIQDDDTPNTEVKIPWR